MEELLRSRPMLGFAKPRATAQAMCSAGIVDSESRTTKSVRTRRPLSVSYRPNLRSLTEFVTTDTDENAIAAAATIGFRNPSAASGIAAVL